MTTQEHKDKLKAEASEEYYKVVIPARKEYDKIRNSAMDKYLKRIKEIESMK